MDYFGWSITLEPGFMLLIGDTPEAHIQLKGAYGRGTRVSLQISANGARTEGIMTIQRIIRHLCKWQKNTKKRTDKGS